jgi:hypothetical protein
MYVSLRLHNPQSPPLPSAPPTARSRSPEKRASGCSVRRVPSLHMQSRHRVCISPSAQSSVPATAFSSAHGTESLTRKAGKRLLSAKSPERPHAIAPPSHSPPVCTAAASAHSLQPRPPPKRSLARAKPNNQLRPAPSTNSSLPTLHTYSIETSQTPSCQAQANHCARLKRPTPTPVQPAPATRKAP